MGPRTKAVDCYTFELLERDDDLPTCRVVSFDPKSADLSVHIIRTEQKDENRSDIMNLSVAVARSLRITHYYRGWQIPYGSISLFCFLYFTRLWYPRLLVLKLYLQMKRIVFLKRNLKRHNSMEILRYVAEYNLRVPVSELDMILPLTDRRAFDEDTLSRAIYGELFGSHRQSAKLNRLIAFHLDALTTRGDLVQPDRTKRRFVLNGRAFKTIEEYDEQERRHREILNLQLALVILTLVLALAALIQSGLIKLPTLVDLTRP